MALILAAAALAITHDFRRSACLSAIYIRNLPLNPLTAQAMRSDETGVLHRRNCADARGRRIEL